MYACTFLNDTDVFFPFLAPPFAQRPIGSLLVRQMVEPELLILLFQVLMRNTLTLSQTNTDVSFSGKAPFWPLEKLLFGHPLENPLLVTHGTNPSDAHGYSEYV